MTKLIKKYLNPSGPIQPSYIPEGYLKQYPTILLDTRSDWQKWESSNSKKTEEENNQLYLNLYLWNWTSPFTTIKITPQNAKFIYDYNNQNAVNLFSFGTGTAYPLTTLGSIFGGIAGDKIGENIDGKRGALIGSILGGIIGGIGTVKGFQTIDNTQFVLNVKAHGISEAFKNMYNKYTAPKTNIKITPFKGNNLDLVRERLNNGGYDMIGISKDATIEIPINHPLVSKLKIIKDNSITHDSNDLFKYTNIQSSVKVNAREFLNKLEAIIDPNESLTHNNAVYKGFEKLMYSPTSGKMLEVDTKNPNLITSHEFWHAVDDVLHQLGKKPLLTLFKSVMKIDDIVDPPGFDKSKITNSKLLKYFTHAYGTELNARLMLLKNWLGKRNPYDPVTVDEWNYARRHYGNTLDNNMLQLFRAVTNPKEFLDWINPKVAGYAGIIGLGTELLNTDK